MLPIILTGNATKPEPRFLVPAINLSPDPRPQKVPGSPAPRTHPAQHLPKALRMACGPGFGTGELLVRTLKVGSPWKLELVMAFLPPSLEVEKVTRPFRFCKIKNDCLERPDCWNYRVLEVRNSAGNDKCWMGPNRGWTVSNVGARFVFPDTGTRWLEFRFENFQIKVRDEEQQKLVFDFTGITLPLLEAREPYRPAEPENPEWQEPRKFERPEGAPPPKHYHHRLLDDVDVNQLKRHFKK